MAVLNQTHISQSGKEKAIRRALLGGAALGALGLGLMGAQPVAQAEIGLTPGGRGTVYLTFQGGYQHRDGAAATAPSAPGGVNPLPGGVEAAGQAVASPDLVSTQANVKQGERSASGSASATPDKATSQTDVEQTVNGKQGDASGSASASSGGSTSAEGSAQSSSGDKQSAASSSAGTAGDAIAADGSVQGASGGKTGAANVSATAAFGNSIGTSGLSTSEGSSGDKQGASSNSANTAGDTINTESSVEGSSGDNQGAVSTSAGATFDTAEAAGSALAQDLDDLATANSTASGVANPTAAEVANEAMANADTDDTGEVDTIPPVMADPPAAIADDTVDTTASAEGMATASNAPNAATAETTVMAEVAGSAVSVGLSEAEASGDAASGQSITTTVVDGISESGNGMAGATAITGSSSTGTGSFVDGSNSGGATTAAAGTDAAQVGTSFSTGVNGSTAGGTADAFFGGGQALSAVNIGASADGVTSGTQSSATSVPDTAEAVSQSENAIDGQTAQATAQAISVPEGLQVITAAVLTPGEGVGATAFYDRQTQTPFVGFETTQGPVRIDLANQMLEADDGAFGGGSFGYVFGAPVLGLIDRVEAYGTHARNEQDRKETSFAFEGVSADGQAIIQAFDTKGLQIATSEVLTQTEFGLRLKSDRLAQGPLPLIVSLEPFYMDYEQEARYGLPEVALFDSTVEADIWGGQVGLESEIPLIARTLNWVGRVAAGVYWMDADGRFANSISGKTLAPGEEETGYRLGAETGLRLFLGDHAFFTATGAVDHLSEAPFAVFRDGLEGMPSYVGTDEFTQYRANLRLTLSTQLHRAVPVRFE